MKKNIPIYSADISVIPCKKTINTIKRENPITLKNIVVKGFTAGDIWKRSYPRIINQFSGRLKKNYYFELKDVTLLKQHGMGVNQ